MKIIGWIRPGFAMKKAGATFKSYLAKRKCWVHSELVF